MINDAQPGDTIIVAAGEYKENIVITKSVYLKGAPDDSIHIVGASGRFPTIQISGDSVYLENLIIAGKTVVDSLGPMALEINRADFIFIKSCTVIGGYVSLKDWEALGVSDAGPAIKINKSANVNIISCIVDGGESLEGAYYYNCACRVDGAHALEINESRYITLDSTTLHGGDGSNGNVGAGSAGLGIKLENSQMIDIRNSIVYSGKQGENNYDNPYHPTDSGNPSMKISYSDSIKIINSQLYASAGTNGGYGLVVDNVENYFDIKSSVINGAGSKGHGVASKSSTIYIYDCAISGGRVYGKDGIGGNGINALNNSKIYLDQECKVLAGGGGWGYGLPGKKYFRDASSIIDTVSLIVERMENQLLQNYPNPFNSTTKIGFELADDCHVLIKIYNIQGRLLDILIDRQMHPGKYEVIYNADKIPSGIYFYSVRFGNYQKANKMILIK
jgi:hypothetical protein